MAVSKSTGSPASDTSQRIRQIFSRSQISEERKREWDQAIRHAEIGSPPLRFPLYEHLYLFNASAQRLIDLLKEIGSSFGIGQKQSLYHQSLIQQVRASVSSDIVDYMSGIERTDEWVFEGLCRDEEKNLRDPDAVYSQVRQREEERTKQGLPPRVRFLDDEPSVGQKR
ncbi:hypothetical protein JAO29_14740 [Edaphobacter sp. HDX4]|uniref:hypothetical protein n=1 Tax=Edaphobacter sp. HDX4 TaxID=2794064 RepID=UPI002FE6BD3C